MNILFSTDNNYVMPTGVLICWTFSDIISIAQQYWVEKKILKIKK